MSTVAEQGEAVEQGWVVVLHMEGQFWLMLNQDNSIKAFRSQDEAVGYFERGYRSHETLSYSWQMSVAMDWMLTQPSVVLLSLAEIQTLLAEPRVAGSRNTTRGVKIDLERGGALWEAGEKPRIMA